MIAYIAALICSLTVLYRPLTLAYLLLLYMFFNGLASRAVANNFRLGIGPVNIYALDFLFALMVLLMIVGWIGWLSSGGRQGSNMRTVRIAVLWVVLFLTYQLSRFTLGYFNQVPLDSLVRMFYADFQAIYFFLPLFFVRSGKQLQHLLLAVVGFALIYPVGQALFASREDAEWMLQGQGTFRLGFGDSAIPLGIGLIAIYLWGKRLWFMALPAAGLVMLAHRSAFIAIVVALVAAAILKGEKIKVIGTMILGGMSAGILLFAVQHFSGEPVLDSGVDRLGETFQSTGTTMARLQSIPYMLGIWLENPLFGVDYQTIYQVRESISEGDRTSALLHPHNFILRALVQYGAIGAGLLFIIIGYSLIVARRLIRFPGLNKIGVLLFSGQIYFALFAAMNTTMGSAGYFFWIMVGCTFWYISHTQSFHAKPGTGQARTVSLSGGRILARKKTSIKLST